jgi:hypothetical protein
MADLMMLWQLDFIAACVAVIAACSVAMVFRKPVSSQERQLPATPKEAKVAFPPVNNEAAPLVPALPVRVSIPLWRVCDPTNRLHHDRIVREGTAAHQKLLAAGVPMRRCGQ